MQQQPTLTPQQQAIQVVRTRYEQGILTFDQFEYAINALIVAQTPEQCQQILNELPSTTATSVLHAPAQPAVPKAPASPGTPTTQSRIVGAIGELKRTQRPWHLEPYTSVRMWMGQVKLDLSLATLPPNGVLEVFVPLGEAIIYVPREAHVKVRAFALLGEIKVLGEERNGIFAHLKDEEFPPETTTAVPAPHLEIRLKTIAGTVKVIRVNGPVMAIKEVLKDVAGQVILAALDAFKQNRGDKALPK
jgi:hypothetical protein